jgi:peptidoglycan/LPS O-acetylase OafA/YrhL
LIIVSIFWPTGIITSGFVGFAIILLCSLNGAVIKFLEKPPFIFLGKICFTLYLVHIPIITSLTSFIVIRFDGLSTGAVICVAGLLTVGVSIVVAWLFMFVEKEMIRLYKKILI